MCKHHHLLLIMKFKKMFWAHKRLVAALTIVCQCAVALALTVEWAYPPSYFSTMKRWRPGIYEVSDGEQSQLIDFATQKMLLETEYGVLTVQYIGDNISVVGRVHDDSGEIELTGILFENEHRLVTYPRGLYAASGRNRWGYPTEGTWRVKDAHGLVGYIDLKGNVLVNCQFAKGRPFRDGLALVQTVEGKLMYIPLDYDTTHKPLKLSVGEIQEGMQFSNGKTFVRNKKGWVMINKKGKKVNDGIHRNAINLYAEATRYEEGNIQANIKQEFPDLYVEQPYESDSIIQYPSIEGLIGYSRMGKVVVPAQFSSAPRTEDFDIGFAAVSVVGNNWMGLLKLVEGDFKSISTDTQSGITADGHVTPLHVKFSYPTNLDTDKLKVMIDLDQFDALIPINDAHFENGICEFTFTPTLSQIKDIDECEMTCQVYADYNLLLWEDTHQVSFIPTSELGISSIKQSGNKSGQTLWSTVHLPPYSQPVKATIELLVAGRLFATGEPVTIHANESKRVEVKTQIEKATQAVARVKLSNGRSREYAVTIEPTRQQSTKPVPKAAHKRYTKRIEKKKLREFTPL